MIERKTGALAIFVKTPGLSPIKTRLAEAIGKESAERFHLLASQAVESVVRQATETGQPGFTPYWAVAEKEALSAPTWHRLQTLWQGDGSLGERLSHVYDELIQQHSFVIFIGADSPQLSSSLLIEAALLMARSRDPAYILGRADDGGFYLFGGTGPVPRSVWLNVPYSAANTAQALAENLRGLGGVSELSHLLDVDTVEDMKRLAIAPMNEVDFTPEQQALIAWVRERIGARK